MNVELEHLAEIVKALYITGAFSLVKHQVKTGAISEGEQLDHLIQYYIIMTYGGAGVDVDRKTRSYLIDVVANFIAEQTGYHSHISDVDELAKVIAAELDPDNEFAELFNEQIEKS